MGVLSVKLGTAVLTVGIAAGTLAGLPGGGGGGGDAGGGGDSMPFTDECGLIISRQANPETSGDPSGDTEPQEEPVDLSALT